jgi:uncharacterized protein YndB with AHSA1/START domain
MHMNATMQDTIEREITVRASKERVYNAIKDPAQIVVWFPDKVEGTMEVGDTPIFDFGDYGKSRVYIAAADPYDYFAYRWIPGHIDFPKGFLGDVLSEPNTLVEFRLTEVPGGTMVKLKESGFASLPPPMDAKKFEENNGGWDIMMDLLGKYLLKE